MNKNVNVYLCVNPASIEIFFDIVFAFTGSSVIGLHVPSSVPLAFNLGQVALKTSSLFVISFMSDCQMIL